MLRAGQCDLCALAADVEHAGCSDDAGDNDSGRGFGCVLAHPVAGKRAVVGLELHMVGQKYKALIVDGEPESRRSTARALAQVGFDADLAGDGHEAQRRLDGDQYDLVVTELKMPKMHGHALALDVLSRPTPPKIVVLTRLTEPRLVRDLLARGVQDFIYKSTPADLLGTKLLSLFEQNTWRQSQASAAGDGGESSSVNLLEDIEKTVAGISDSYAEQLKSAFETEDAIASPPRNMAEFVKQLAMDERAQEQADMSRHANVRAAARVAVQTTAVAVEMNADLKPQGSPFQLALRDISKTGARLLNTRTLSSTHLAVSWKAVTLRYCTFYLPLTVTRSQPIGRFYDVGGKFGV